MTWIDAKVIKVVCMYINYAGNVNSLSNNQKQLTNWKWKKEINKYVTNMKMTCINKNQFN